VINGRSTIGGRTFYDELPPRGGHPDASNPEGAENGAAGKKREANHKCTP
jgi:hypothetical protein